MQLVTGHLLKYSGLDAHDVRSSEDTSTLWFSRGTEEVRKFNDLF